MTVYLDTKFNTEETQTLNTFIDGGLSCDVSIVYAIDTDLLRGLTMPNRMIHVGGLYLCEEKDEPGQWYMGQLTNGTYDFWGCYGNLQDAIAGL